MISYKNNDKDNNNILFEIINNNIIIIKLNRDNRRNAVDKVTADKLYDIFKEFNDDEKLDIAILYGGESNFCSGADLKEISNNNSNRLISPKETDNAPMGCTRLKLNKPVICAINGYCVAGGLELALWCDLRVCSNGSMFGVLCRRWGVPLIDGGSVRLPRLVGGSRAMDLILTGRLINANEALQFGLVNRVVENGKSVLEASIDLAKQISSYPKVCLRNDRLSAIQQWDLSFDQALENEFNLGYKSFKIEGQNGSIKFNNGQGRSGTFINNTNDINDINCNNSINNINNINNTNTNNNSNNLISKL